MSELRGYDAWLEKPYQDEQRRGEEAEEREYDPIEDHAAWEQEMQTQHREAQWEREQDEANEREDAEVDAYRCH